MYWVSFSAAFTTLYGPLAVRASRGRRRATLEGQPKMGRSFIACKVCSACYREGSGRMGREVCPLHPMALSRMRRSTLPSGPWVSRDGSVDRRYLPPCEAVSCLGRDQRPEGTHKSPAQSSPLAHSFPPVTSPGRRPCTSGRSYFKQQGQARDKGPSVHRLPR
ncbi:hypothetical protein CALCODRAFT_323909 [Calocera cornea HHB12733]|uniref:Uncharacterized protein n=1 Tax=Calocera cornea HHB12733 TaxID=1353952 RepID=A0A165F5V5_9BASI|nr:hypothetical protein CALCODRAFT_323909 [Calocera cornea HHB12733]